MLDPLDDQSLPLRMLVRNHWIIGSQSLDEKTVARGRHFSHDDTVKGAFLSATPS